MKDWMAQALDRGCKSSPGVPVPSANGFSVTQTRPKFHHHGEFRIPFDKIKLHLSFSLSLSLSFDEILSLMMIFSICEKKFFARNMNVESLLFSQLKLRKTLSEKIV